MQAMLEPLERTATMAHKGPQALWVRWVRLDRPVHLVMSEACLFRLVAEFSLNHTRFLDTGTPGDKGINGINGLKGIKGATGPSAPNGYVLIW